MTVGFTAGIAVIILASQLRELLGLDIAHEPTDLVPKLSAIWQSLGTIKPAAITLSAIAIALILGLRRFLPKWPGMLIAVQSPPFWPPFSISTSQLSARNSARCLARSLPHRSLTSHSPSFMPSSLMLSLSHCSEPSRVLLSAVVADGMSGRKHRSNCELVAQGIANIASMIFGGMCATGTIARTATNVRAGARSPVSGMLHAVYILLFMLVAAPLAVYIPLASLGGVLAVVAWNMAEKEEFVSLLRASKGDATVLLATFYLTIFANLTVAIAVGVALGAFLFLHRMAEAVEVETGGSLITDDVADATGAGRTAYDPGA